MARTNRDSRRKRQDWATNPVITGGSAALMQAVAPVLDWARWQKNIINKFDDKGRPDHKVEWVDFQCIITPMERSRSATAGGDRFYSTLQCDVLEAVYTSNRGHPRPSHFWDDED